MEESLFGPGSACYHWLFRQYRNKRDMDKVKAKYYLYDTSIKVVLDRKRQEWLWKQAERRQATTANRKGFRQRKRADGLTDVQCHYLGLKGAAAVLLAYRWPTDALRTIRPGGVGLMGDAVTPSGKTVQIKLPQGRNRQFALPSHRKELEADYGVLVWPDTFNTPVTPTVEAETLQVIGWCDRTHFGLESEDRTFHNGSQKFIKWDLLQGAKDFPDK